MCPRKRRKQVRRSQEKQKRSSIPQSGEPEKAQIAVEGADHLYREIRVPNRLVDGNGHKVKLKEGAEVDVKIEADQVVTNKLTGTDETENPSKRAPL